MSARAVVEVERSSSECEPSFDQHLDGRGQWRPESEQH